jgi:hypothetical protein
MESLVESKQMEENCEVEFVHDENIGEGVNTRGRGRGYSRGNARGGRGAPRGGRGFGPRSFPQEHVEQEVTPKPYSRPHYHQEQEGYLWIKEMRQTVVRLREECASEIAKMVKVREETSAWLTEMKLAEALRRAEALEEELKACKLTK